MDKKLPTNGEESYSFESFNAQAFAEWLSRAYRESRFKSLVELARETQSNKATISRLMSGAPQTLTGRPSQPKPALVIALAKALNADEKTGLFHAGHPVYGRPYKKPESVPELLEQLEEMGIEVTGWNAVKDNFDNYTPEDLQELKEQIAANVGVKINRIRQR